MKTGIELIAAERQRQIDADRNSELPWLAWYYGFGKCDSKTCIQQLAVVGALIAAEIDRLLAAKRGKGDRNVSD